MTGTFGKIESTSSGFGAAPEQSYVAPENRIAENFALKKSAVAEPRKSKKPFALFFALLCIIGVGVFFSNTENEPTQQTQLLDVGRDTYIDINEPQSIDFKQEVQPEKALQLTSNFDINECLKGNDEQFCVEMFDRSIQ